MKTMFTFFVLGVLVGVNYNDIHPVIERNPYFFITILIFLLIYLVTDVISIILRIYKNVKKMRFTKDMMKKFREAKMKTMEEI